MGFLNEARAEVKVGGQACSLCTALDAWSKKDQDEFWAAIDDPTIPATAIHRALRGRDVWVKEGTVQKHRREGCARRGLH